MSSTSVRSRPHWEGDALSKGLKEVGGEGRGTDFRRSRRKGPETELSEGLRGNEGQRGGGTE